MANSSPARSLAVPQAGDRYSKRIGLGLESIIIEQAGEPAQVIKTPDNYTIKGWNANLPSDSFFEHSALLLTMLAVNLDLPLMFLLLDGSLVNFHGGRMTFDQAKLRFRQLQSDHAQGLWYPTYHWRTRQRITPGSSQFDPKLYAAVTLEERSLISWPHPRSIRMLKRRPPSAAVSSRLLMLEPWLRTNEGIDADQFDAPCEAVVFCGGLGSHAVVSVPEKSQAERLDGGNRLGTDAEFAAAGGVQQHVGLAVVVRSGATGGAGIGG